MSIRITELDAINSLQDGDYVAVDNESTGTHKFKALDISANVAGNIANTYSSSASYAIGQYCLYNNNLYRCTTTISTPEAWNGAHWVQVTVGEGLYDKVDKVSGKALSANDFTNAYKTKLDGIEAGAEVNVQANWTESDSSKDDYIKNKPVNATTDASGFMSASDKQKLDSIANGAEVNVQANWTESDSSKDDYIKNKPTIDETLNLNSNNAVRNSAITAGINQVQGNLDTEITNRQNAVSGEQLARENADNALDGRLDTVEETLPNKANINGSYINLTAGTAKQLESTARANDQTPYLFRTSGGSVDIGDREYINSITGGSIAWNQLIPNGDFASQGTWTGRYADVTVSGGVATATVNSSGTQRGLISGDTTRPLVLANHKYFIGTDVLSPITSRVSLSMNGGAGVEVDITANVWKRCEGLWIVPSGNVGTATMRPYILITGTTTEGQTIQYKNVVTFDLTQMFGSTIADYIYSLEQNHAGDGVAWFKKYFPNPYYAYNAGELMHVSALTSHDMTGFNQWDEEWEFGTLDGNGQPTTNSMRIRSKNYIPILPSTTYYGAFVNVYASGSWYSICYYDADKNFISNTAPYKNNTFTTPSNAYYMKFNTSDGWGGVAYTGGICFNLSWDGSRDGEYEPYELYSYPLDSDLVLRGIPKLDAYNRLYYDGDTYESDGTVTRKYDVVDLGTLTWSNTASATDLSGATVYYTYASYPNTFITGATPSGVSNALASIGCQRPNKLIAEIAWSNYDWTISYMNSANRSMYMIFTDGAKTGSEVQTLLNGHKMVIELKDPTTEEIDPYISPQVVNDFGTEQYVTTSIVPVGHDTDYTTNLVAKLEMSPDSPEGDGDYIVRQVNGVNQYVPLVIEDVLPIIPSTEGSYKLVVTVAEGTDPVLSWEANV